MNVKYLCRADCVHNNGTKYVAPRPCSLKNADLKPDKDTVTCIGDKCGFYEENKQKEKEKENEIQQTCQR